VSIPPYEVRDPIVELYVEKGQGLQEIVAAGHDPETARGVLQLVDRAEPLRRLVPPGVKITARAFGKDRRMPITNAWRPFRYEEARLASTSEPTAGQASSS
jgi:NAD+ synthase (glutamine-hydrolysing)